MERLGAGRVSADSFLWQREGHVPLLSQAGASALSAVRFAHQHRSRRSRAAHFNAVSYSRLLTDEAGEFHTQGIAEDTKALSDGVLDDKEYLQQARTVLAEHRRIFDAEFPKFKHGLFFFYFSSLDLNSHMFWRLMDPKHPEYDAALAAQNGSAIERLLSSRSIRCWAKCCRKLDDHTTLLVLSDHGFAPYYRSFNLNTWLLNNGYIKLKTDATLGLPTSRLRMSIGAQTRAYGMGLNGLYLNLRGRESNGIVEPGTAPTALMAEIRESCWQCKIQKRNCR